ncbi:amidohydrolase family protein [Microlunatus panaciterrae]|uniref:N-acyl-D-amino-acid deacylase n=1 Tax=Microlunatus panaciterrae TaxID=400768 RepID=A0ABS2RKI0_9ACTN|nr:amidohydrolase family protein [Microlunatus panaciterrae]MBM7799077.1 N-acyl-D-amino-acid deacylase [Microlunatus panaciterrae]
MSPGPDPSHLVPVDCVVILAGGTVVDGIADQGRRADLEIVPGRSGQPGRIGRIGELDPAPDDVVIDCTDRLLLPGLIDAHSHADAQVFSSDVALALLRQGVTSVIAGQDGVSFAPGDGRYARDYFAAINGAHPGYTGGGVAELLAGYDETTPVNVAYLVPAGTVRHLVMADHRGRPDAAQLAAMQDHIRRGLAEGAVGMSTGLDYVPGCFADTAELTALCAPVAAAGGVYVTHMRGGYEDNAAAGVDEVVEICRGSRVRAHISHFHARPELITGLVEQALRAGVDLTFDSYPYSRGCSMLGMLMLPPDLMQDGFEAAVEQLSKPEVQDKIIADWIPIMAARADMGPGWADNITLAHIAAPEFAWAHGLSLSQAARRQHLSPAQLGVRVMAASRLEVGVVMGVPQERTDDQMALHLNHRAHMGGSDGIFLGQRPHPRGWGSFARYLSVFTVDRGDLTWAQVAQRFGRAPADRFGLAGRGSLVSGAAADVIVVDPARVRSNASYDRPRALADGIDDVFVNGRQVLGGGELTGIMAGLGLRHHAAQPTGAGLGRRPVEPEPGPVPRPSEEPS